MHKGRKQNDDRRGLAGGGVESNCLMRTEIQVWKMKKAVQIDGWWSWLHNKVTVPNAIELYT